jgi:hypothetical protein
MSALPYGSAHPYGSAIPQQAYGSAFPTAPIPYPTYGSAYPSYNQGFQQFPTYAAAPTYYPEPSTAAAPVAPTKEADQKRKPTTLDKQLAAVKELEKQLEKTVQDLELEHVKLNQRHSAEFNALFQQQTQVLVTENQKVMKIYDDIPQSILPEESALPKKPDMRYPPTGPSSQLISAEHPMIKLKETQNFITSLRKDLDKKCTAKFP